MPPARPEFNPYAPPRPPTRPASEPAPPADAAGTLSVSVHVSDADVAEFLASHHARRSRLGPMARIALPLVIVIAVIDLALWNAGRFTVFTAISNVVWLAIALVLFPWLWRRALRKMASRGGPRGEHTLEIGPGGLATFAQGRPAVRRSWSTVPRIAATPNQILFYVSDPDAEVVSVEIVPRREFATPEAADAFLDAARRWRDRAVEAGGSAAADPVADPAGPCLSVTFEPDEADRLEADRNRRRALRREHRGALVWFGVGLIWLTFLGVRLAQRAGEPGGLLRDESLPDMALFGMMLGISVSAFVAWVRQAARRRRREPSGPVTLTITPEGYTICESVGGRVLSQAWAATPGVGSRDGYLVIAHQVLDPRRGLALHHLIPRRAFADDPAADAFLDAARRWHAQAHGLPAPAGHEAGAPAAMPTSPRSEGDPDPPRSHDGLGGNTKT